MTKVMNQGACEMTADELELVSGGGLLRPAAKAQGTEPLSTLETIACEIVARVGF